MALVTFPFGKHAGETVEAVAASDPGYIAWALAAGIAERYPTLGAALRAAAERPAVAAAVVEQASAPPRERRGKGGRAATGKARGQKSAAPAGFEYVHDDENEGPDPYATLTTSALRLVADTNAVEHAKQLRVVLAKAFPGVKFSVANGGSYDTYRVKWTDGPSEAMVKRVTRLFEGKSFDSMQDLQTYKAALVFDKQGRPVGTARYGIGYIFENRQFSRAFLDGALARTRRLPGGVSVSVRDDGSFGARLAVVVDTETTTGRTSGGRAPWDIERDAIRAVDADHLSAAFYGGAHRKRAQAARDAARDGRPDPVLAAKMRASAGKIEAAAQGKLNNATAQQNPTRRRASIAAGMEAEGERMMHAARALRTLADLTDAGTAPAEVAGVSSQLAALQLSGAAVWGTSNPTGTAPDWSRESLRDVWGRLAGAEDAAASKTRAEREGERALIGLKIDGFFPTPPDLADRMVAEAAVEDGERVLEPSAGKGDLVAAVLRAAPGAVVEAVEVNTRLRALLETRGVPLVAVNFLNYNPGPVYDAVVMNPPFEDGADAAHIRHAFGCLKPCGRLVAIAGEGLFFRADRAGFRAWLESVGGAAEKLPDGSFVSAFRSTGVAARLVVITAPDAYVPPVAAPATAAPATAAPATAAPATAAPVKAPVATAPARASKTPTRVPAASDDGLTVAERAEVRAALPVMAAAVGQKVGGGANRKAAGEIMDLLRDLADLIGLGRDALDDAFEAAEYDAREGASVRDADRRPAPKPAAPKPAAPKRAPSKPSPAEQGVPFRVPTFGMANQRTFGRAVDVLFSADGALVEPGHYEVLGLGDVVASHNPDCTANADHRLPGAQPRDRSAKDLCRQADQIAAKLNPAVLVSLGTSAFDGPPVVTADGIVIQGNGRSISLRVAYERYPAKAAAYRAYLVQHAADFGLTAEAVAFFRSPVLVRTVEVSDARAVRLGNALNTAEAPQAPLDRAKALARALPLAKRRSLGAAVQALLDATDADTLRGALDAPDAVGLIDRLPGIERNGLVAQGTLTTGGKDLLRDVLVALLVDDGTPGVNARYEALPYTSRIGVERALGHLVALVGTPHDLGPRLRAACEIVRRVKSSPSLTRAADVLNQADAFEASPFTEDDAALADLLLTAKTQRDVSTRLAAYARLSNGYTNLFESVAPAAPAEAFRRAVVEGERPNGRSVTDGLAVAFLGRAVELTLAGGQRYTDPAGDTLLVWVPELRRLLLVPAERAAKATRRARGDAGRAGALAAYGQWQHADPDGLALALDLPPAALARSLPRTARVGTGRSIRYLADKLMRPGDRKGTLNGYHHDFDSGRRAVHEIPYPTGGTPVLSVSALAIDGRGILN